VQLLIGINATLDGVTLANPAGVTFAQNAGYAYVQNGLTLAGGTTLDLANGTNGFSGSLLTTAIGGGPTFGGNGTISFGSNTGFTYIYNYTSTNALTIGPGIFVHGKSGEFLNYFPTDGGFINQGTITADIAGGTFVLGGSFTNQGTIQALPGAALSIQASRFVQTAGALRSTATDVAIPNVLVISGGSAALASISGNSGTTVLGNIAAGPTVPMTVGSITQNTLTIHNTGVLTVPMSTNRVTSVVTTLSMDGAGTFDLGNNELVTNTAPATIRGYLAQAYDPAGNADWGQAGLTSSIAKGNPTVYSVGYAFGGDQSAIDADVRRHNGVAPGTNQTIVRAVLTGDANMDGKVDFFDISQLLGYKYNTGQAASYTDGDLNYDGVVDFFDIATLLSANYNTGQVFGPAGVEMGAEGAAIVAPEPGGGVAVLLAMGGWWLGRRRRRRESRGHRGGEPMPADACQAEPNP
jgi:hypothetical protein